jgi:calcium binding protein 39
LIHKNICNFAAYVQAHFSMVLELIGYYTMPDVSLTCGTMLRECIRYDELARTTLESDMLWAFFDTYVHLPNFDAASDAFNTLRDLLTTTRNKTIASEFLDRNYDKVFSKYELLLHSENYVTRRRSLKLLGELLLDRR